MKKRIISIILTLILLISFGTNAFAEEQIPLKLYSDAALVCDMNTGEVIYSLNADTRRYPASITKMLTAIIAIETLPLDTVVLADTEAAAAGGNSIHLKGGEKFVLKDLLYGTMVVSANDGAVAIAKAVSGSVEEFAKLMNKKAEAIGCTGSHFVNPNGLHDDDHYSTARDIATIAMYCMKNEIFRDIVSHANYTIPKTNLSAERYVESTNWLLYDEQDSHRVYAGSKYRYCKYDGCIGIKTGQTSKAGCCLVAAAKRDNTTVLTVCLHAGNTFERFADAIQLLDLGFSKFKTVNSMQKGNELGTVKVKKGSVKTVKAVLLEDILTTIKDGESNDIFTTEIVLDESVKAPVAEGQKLGTVYLKKSGEIIMTYDAVASEAIPEGGFLSNFGITDAAAHTIGKIIKIIFLVIFVLILALAVYVFYERQRIKKKKARKAAKMKARMERENLNKTDLNKDDF